MEDKLLELKSLLENAKKENVELKAQFDTLKSNSVDKAEVEEKMANLDTTIAELKAEIKEMQKVKASGLDAVGAFTKLVESEEFKKGLEGLRESKTGRVFFEIKSSTADLTGTVGRSLVLAGIDSDAQKTNMLYEKVPKYTIGQDKSNLVWVEASFTDATDYIDEAGTGTDNSLSAAEKTRGLAKIQTSITFTEEMMTDLNQLVNWFKNEAITAIKTKVDTEIVSGLGADTSAATKKKIYGVQGQGSTAFNATTAGMAASLASPDFYSLLLAIKAQAQIATNGMYSPVDVYINPADMALISDMRDANNNSIDVDRLKTNLGITVHSSVKMVKNTLLAISAGTVELHEKRSFELEIERKASTDSYAMYVRWRGQALVRASKKKGNIYVAAIDTAIAALKKTAA